ncbi:MAG: CDP-diacylglycerol--serine O-phosphatidyltransferase [bacterium]|nr:CDP-diacylglycerol--serine O-phosphatidyltransferase [bacterium]
MNNVISIIPSIVTLLNLLLGFVAIVTAGFNQLLLSSWLIVFAAIFDFFDGRIARLSKVSSRFGAELDSLSDVVSFGVAPSMLMVMYLLSIFSLPQFQIIDKYFQISIFLCFLPVMAGALRLARYNITQAVDLNKKSDFIGLPIPMSALLLTSFVMFHLSTHVFKDTFFLQFSILIVLVTFLMISQIRYKTFPKISFTPISNGIQFILSIILLAIICIKPNVMLFPVMMVYLMSGILITIYEKLSRKSEDKV